MRSRLLVVLLALCAAAGLVVGEIRGVALKRPAPMAVWEYARQRTLGGFTLSDDRRFTYIGYATRPLQEAVR